MVRMQDYVSKKRITNTRMVQVRKTATGLNCTNRLQDNGLECLINMGDMVLPNRKNYKLQVMCQRIMSLFGADALDARKREDVYTNRIKITLQRKDLKQIGGTSKSKNSGVKWVMNVILKINGWRFAGYCMALNFSGCYFEDLVRVIIKQSKKGEIENDYKVIGNP